MSIHDMRKGIFKEKYGPKRISNRHYDLHLGYLYGELETDCCGCKAVKCLKCEPPAPKADTCPSGAGARPIGCYTYTKESFYASDNTKCYRPKCDENPSDAPADEVSG